MSGEDSILGPLFASAFAAGIFLSAVGWNPLSELRAYRRWRGGTWFRSTGLIPRFGTRWHRARANAYVGDVCEHWAPRWWSVNLHGVPDPSGSYRQAQWGVWRRVAVENGWDPEGEKMKEQCREIVAR